MMYHHSTRTYVSKEGARDAARRFFNKDGNVINVSGLRYRWSMDNVVVYREGGRFAWYIELGAPMGAEADSEPQMDAGTRQALADAFFRQQAGLAELQRRRAERAGLAGCGFRPGY